MNIARTIEHGRQHYPDRPALIFEGTEITYAALDDAANSVARALRDRRIGRGDRVALLMPNVPEFAYAYFGALKLGAIVVSIDTSLLADEIERIVQDCGAAILLSELTAFTPRSGPAIEAVDLPADAPAAIVYTPATTGVPKGATLSHGNVRFVMFHTGDIGRSDVDGDFFIEDRIEDMVMIGGSNVYPAEIENVLHQHPAVAAAAVFGVPAPVFGERVWAAVVRAPGASATEAEIIAFCRARMAHHKVPARVEFVDELPRNRTGKVVKRVLRQRHAAPAAPITPSAASGMHRDEFNVPVTPDVETIQVWLLRWLGETLHAERPLDPERPLEEEGVTSVMGVELASALERWLGRPVPPTIAWQHPTVSAIARHLAPAAAAGPLGAQHAVDALAAEGGFIDLSALENLSEADAETLLVEELRRLQG